MVYKRVMVWLNEHLSPTPPTPLTAEQSAEVVEAHGNWRRMKRETKFKVVSLVMERTSAASCIREWAVLVWPPMTSGKNDYLHSRSVLFTWNGPWGKVNCDVIQKGLLEDVLCELLQDRLDVEIMWESFLDFIAELSKRLGSELHGCSMEVCGETWEEEKYVRIHAHAFFKSTNKMRVHDPSPFLFRCGLPNKAESCMGHSVRSTGGYAGLYYIIAPKLFGLFQYSSVKPFKEFPVSPEWIFNLVQAGKCYTAART